MHKNCGTRTEARPWILGSHHVLQSLTGVSRAHATCDDGKGNPGVLNPLLYL